MTATRATTIAPSPREISDESRLKKLLRRLHDSHQGKFHNPTGTVGRVIAGLIPATS